MAEGEEVSFISGSEIIFDFFCELCIDDNKQVEAEGYCVDCREYLCEPCYKAHKRTRSTRQHVLQDKHNMPKDTPLSTDRVNKEIITKCTTHSGKTVKYYCRSHSAFGCSTCFVKGHRACKAIEPIADISENIFESQDYKDFKESLKSIQKKSRDIVASARENKTVSERCCIDAVASVRQLKEEVIVMLNEIEQSIVTLIEQMKSEDEERMESIVENCNAMSDKIDKLSSEFESLWSSKRACQMYINMRETEGDVKTLQENIRKIETTNAVETFMFEPNAELTSYLRSPGVLGNIKIVHQNQQDRESGPVPSNTTATKVASIGVTSSNDTRRCGISGSAVISINRLITVDYNHDKVKLVDTQTNKILSELKVSSHLSHIINWDVAIINRNQVAVTFPHDEKILLLRLADTLTAEKEIAVVGNCHGVAYNKDRLFVTFVDNPHLEITDLHGNVIKTIKNSSDGKELFEKPCYVCVSEDGETIYVSDNSRGTVTGLTADGIVKGVYKDEELRSPHGVCTDHQGYVYVCGRDSRNVHMITADCKKVKVILTQVNGLDSDVYSVSYCQDTNRLFIGMFGNKVNVYQLS